MIEVFGLTKKYGDHYAVKDVGFTVEKGKIYGFLGPNGAGKSTVMNIITGYISATSGKVLINGFDIVDEPQKAKACIGYLPEIPPVYPDMTVREYLLFAASIKGVPASERENEVSAVMEKTAVTSMQNRLIRNLSKGYRQRVGLSQALLGNPEIIILDEPSVGLDPQQIIEMRELIKSLANEHTVILSSHILSEISAVCDRILIINEGSLIASDTPENLARLISDNEKIEMTAIGDAQTVGTALSPLKDVSFAVIPQGEGLVKIAAKGAYQTDIRRLLAVTLAENKIPVIDISSQSASLEEIFLQLTKGGESK